MKKQEGVVCAYRALSLLPFYSMVGLGLSASVVMQQHLQNLVSLGYRTTAELATYRVPKDPTSPVPVGGYIMANLAFFERGFGVPSH
jgi:hypothetical protein